MAPQVSDKHPRYPQDGAVMLISVLLVGAIGMAISVSLLLLGLNSSRLSLASQQSRIASALANTCAEQGLQGIWDSEPYAGSGSLNRLDGTCTYTVTHGTGEARTVTAEGTAGTVVRRVKVTIDALNPVIHIVSWEEVADLN